MRRLVYRISLIATAFSLSYSVGAQEKQTPVRLGVQDAIEYALENRDFMKNARLDQLITLAKNAEITGIALPQVNASGQFQYYVDPQKSFVPGEILGAPGTFVPVQFTPTVNTNATATVSQVLFDGSVVVALQARKTFEQLADLSVKKSAEDIRADVAKSYYNVLVVEKQLEILNTTYQDIKKIAAQNQILYEQGIVEKLVVDQSKVQVNNTLTQKISLENSYAVTLLALKFQIGMPINQVIVLTDTLYNNMVTTADLLETRDFEYSQRLDYNLVKTQLEVSELDLKRYRWQNLPSLAASYTGGYLFANNSFQSIFNSEHLWFSVIGLNLRVPIFDGLQRRNRVKQAKFTVEKSQNDLHAVKQGIDLQQSTARTTLRNSLIVLENQRQNYELAESVFKLSQIKFKEGVGSNVEVVQAETSLLQAQSNFFNALMSALHAKVDLQKALGLLNQ